MDKDFIYSTSKERYISRVENQLDSVQENVEDYASCRYFKIHLGLQFFASDGAAGQRATAPIVGGVQLLVADAGQQFAAAVQHGGHSAGTRARAATQNIARAYINTTNALKSPAAWHWIFLMIETISKYQNRITSIQIGTTDPIPLFFLSQSSLASIRLHVSTFACMYERVCVTCLFSSRPAVRHILNTFWMAMRAIGVRTAAPVRLAPPEHRWARVFCVQNTSKRGRRVLLLLLRLLSPLQCVMMTAVVCCAAAADDDDYDDHRRVLGSPHVCVRVCVFVRVFVHVWEFHTHIRIIFL